jgi:hypothetical protein
MNRILQHLVPGIVCLVALPACTSVKQTMVVRFTNIGTQTVMLTKPDFGPEYDEKALAKAMREFEAKRDPSQAGGDLSPIIVTPLVERRGGGNSDAGAESGAVIGAAGAVAGVTSPDRPVITLPPQIKPRPKPPYRIKPGETIIYPVGQCWPNRSTGTWEGSRYGGLDLYLVEGGRPVQKSFPTAWFSWFHDNHPAPTTDRRIHLGNSRWDGKSLQFRSP